MGTSAKSKFIMNNTHRYLVKIIAATSFLYGIFGIYAGIAVIHNLLKLRALGLAEGMPNTNLIVGYAAIGAVVGFVGAIGSLGLFFLKKWGFYIISLFFILLWIYSLMAEGGIAKDWPTLLTAAVFFFYILSQKKLFSPDVLRVN